MKITKVKKKFKYEGVELRIVDTEEPYLDRWGNSIRETPLKLTRILAPNGGKIPYNTRKNESLKSIVDSVTKLLDGFSKRGSNVKEELTKEI